eukprot:1184665-Prorocentrum_minimum.AAC.1
MDATRPCGRYGRGRPAGGGQLAAGVPPPDRRRGGDGAVPPPGAPRGRRGRGTPAGDAPAGRAHVAGGARERQPANGALREARPRGESNNIQESLDNKHA